MGNPSLQKTGLIVIALVSMYAGSWSGVPNPPPGVATYKSAVETAVAQSIREAMHSLLSPQKPAPKLSSMSMGEDPATALSKEIATATHQAADEALTVQTASRAVAKLRARRAQRTLLKSTRPPRTPQRLPAKHVRHRKHTLASHD